MAYELWFLATNTPFLVFKINCKRRLAVIAMITSKTEICTPWWTQPHNTITGRILKVDFHHKLSNLSPLFFVIFTFKSTKKIMWVQTKATDWFSEWFVEYVKWPCGTLPHEISNACMSVGKSQSASIEASTLYVKTWTRAGKPSGAHWRGDGI